MSTAAIEVAFFDLGDTLVITSNGWVNGAKAAISALKTKGIRLGIISNTGDLSRSEVLEILPADFDLSEFAAELVVLSSEVGHEKPAPAIFALAVTRSGIDAGRCLYCSENLIETLAAQSIGMRAARVSPGPSSDISKLLNGLVTGGLLA